MPPPEEYLNDTDNEAPCKSCGASCPTWKRQRLFCKECRAKRKLLGLNLRRLVCIECGEDHFVQARLIPWDKTSLQSCAEAKAIHAVQMDRFTSDPNEPLYRGNWEPPPPPPPKARFERTPLL